MKIIITPDSFKGSLSSFQAADAIERGIVQTIKDCKIVKLPVADGGEGTIEVFEYLRIGRTIHKNVTGPIGDRISAKYILTDDHMAVIEMAQASGLTLLNESQKNPMKTTTYGTGELIKDAVSKGAKKILLAIGGSATNDGGAGLAQALGISFLNKDRKAIGFGCEGLKDLDRIEYGSIDTRLNDIEFVIASDVQNTLCGPEGASHVYGPQKGANVDMINQMDALLNLFADKMLAVKGIDVRRIKGSGAAGGVAVPLVAFFNANIVSGIETMLEYIGFEKHIKDANYIVTGEGKIDGQTQCGKVISGILKYAKEQNIPVIAFCGILEKGYASLIEAGLKSCFCISPGVVDLHDAMANADIYLEDCAKRVAYLIS